MNEFELKYGCNPNQKPSRIFMADGSELPVTILNGRPGYINFLDNSPNFIKAIYLFVKYNLSVIYYLSITCITDTFLRGTNLDNAVVIIDEAQNYTVAQLKKVLTRVGSRSKVIVIGHELQCDLDSPETSGFAKYIEHFKDQKRTAVCTLVNNHRGWISRHADELPEV